MISLDTSLLFSAQDYLLKVKRTNAKAYGSIDKFSEANATQKTPEYQPINYNDIDYEELIKALQFQLPENRLRALKMMKYDDLMKILFHLEKKNLLIGMKFFNKQKLVKFIQDMPKEDMLKMLFVLYNKEQLLAMMPIKELSRFLDSTKIDPNNLKKIVKNLPQHLMMQIYESATGKSVGNKSGKQLSASLTSMKHELLVDGIKSLPQKEMRVVISSLLEQDKKLYMEFSHQALFQPFEKMHKMSIIQSMQALEPDQIIKMLGELPKELLAQVDTLLDPTKFSQLMQSDFKDVLAQIAIDGGVTG